MNDFDTFWHEAKAALRVALQWFFLAVPMGLLCGFLGTLFHLAVEHATELRAAQPWLLFLLPVAGLLINALYKVTKCEGVGTNNVIRAVQSGEPVSILLVPAIFLGTVLTHLCGGSAGREGAALQMGGSIGWNLGTLLRLKDHDRRTATISGMAAFFSALFGTPLAAACFAMMVEDVGLTFTSAFVPAFTSALIAYGCSLVFGIAPTHFALTAPELNVRTALLVILLGVACAAVSRLFCYTLHFMEHTVPKLLPNPWVRVFAGGVLPRAAHKEHGAPCRPQQRGAQQLHTGDRPARDAVQHRDSYPGLHRDAVCRQGGDKAAAARPDKRHQRRPYSAKDCARPHALPEGKGRADQPGHSCPDAEHPAGAGRQHQRGVQQLLLAHLWEERPHASISRCRVSSCVRHSSRSHGSSTVLP